MSTLTVVQARMGSQRLPGKALADVGGKPILQHVIERARRADLGPLVVATSARSADNHIANLCERIDVPCFRGSEDNVLRRFYYAALAFDAYHEDDVIVRVTADCPLLCPHLLGVVALLAAVEVDYAGVTGCPNGLGQEALRFGALEEAWHDADKPKDREHVITFITARPERFDVTYVEPEPWMRKRKDWRLTVDEEQDLDLLRRLYAATDGTLFDLDSRAVLDAVAADAGMSALAARRP